MLEEKKSECRSTNKEQDEFEEEKIYYKRSARNNRVPS